MAPTKCPHCGAPAPQPTADPSVFMCNFCQNTFRDQPPVMPAQMIVVRTGGGGAGPLVAIFVVVALLVLMGAGIATFLLVRSGGDSRSTPTTSKKAATVDPGDEPMPTPTPKVKAPKAAATTEPKASGGPRWGSGSIFPIGVDVDGDGVEDVLGPTTQKEGENEQIWVSAFDGKTFAPKYRVGPFGAATRDLDRKITVAAAGKRFVVLDPKGDAHLHELADGKLVADFPFKEENRGMCGPPGAEPTVLVRVGKGDQLIDTAKAAIRPGVPPPWCAGDKYMRRRPSESFNSYFSVQAELLQSMGFTRERLEALKPPPKMKLAFALVDGPLTVGVAMGIAEASDTTLIGFDGKGSPTYQVAGKPLGLSFDHHNQDLAFGRFVFARNDGAVTAMDAKTGDKLWDFKPSEGKNRPAKMALTAARVYLVRNDGDRGIVTVLDATSGKLLGTLGQ